MKYKSKALAKNGKDRHAIHPRRRYKRRGFHGHHRQRWIVVTGLIFLALLSFCSYYYKDHDLSRRELLECDEEETTTLDPEESGSQFLFEDIFTMEQLKSGAIGLHVIGILYTFLGLAIICDSY